MNKLFGWRGGPKRFPIREQTQTEGTLFFNIRSAHNPSGLAIWGQFDCFG